MSQFESINTTMNVLAERVRVLRESRGWSQTEMAQRIGASYPRISEIENGKGNPRLSTLLAIADAFGVPLEALIKPPKKKSRHSA